MEKLHEYQGWGGRCHEWRDSLKEKYQNWRQGNTRSFSIVVQEAVQKANQNHQNRHAAKENEDYSHVYRRKTRLQLVRVSSAVMGIEFSYAAETAFVSPTLLKIGVPHQHMTLVWCLSPLVGFFLTPILGSLSDRCKSDMGRRRPFIILLSIGVFIGLLLVPNGEDIGYAMGDFNPYANITNSTFQNILPHRTTSSQINLDELPTRPGHPWGIFFTILGTVLLDFDADACQSPARAYLLDVTVPEDHAKGLSTFTIMAGLGGFFGYSLGGINWDETSIGIAFGGHVRAVFSLITIIFIICVTTTITSFAEIPLWMLEATSDVKPNVDEEKNALDKLETSSYGTLETNNEEEMAIEKNQKRRYTMPPLPTHNHDYDTLPGDNVAETSFSNQVPHPAPKPTEEGVASLSHYLMSIVFMPLSLRMVCLTNLFCWMAHVCYSLYFTDFVGESVFMGDPKAIEGTIEYDLYEEGVRFGCWGMAMYSLSCSCYSLVIEKLIKKYRARRVYVGGLLFYSVSMALMALTKHKASVIIFSWGAGVMYSTLFTMPYLLVANYHSQGVFEVDSSGEAKLGTELRGLGTDVAIVSSMVFLAQFILSMCMGSIVSISGTTTAVVSVASFLAFCGSISATQIMYLDL